MASNEGNVQPESNGTLTSGSRRLRDIYEASTSLRGPNNRALQRLMMAEANGNNGTSNFSGHASTTSSTSSNNRNRTVASGASFAMLHPVGMSSRLARNPTSSALESNPNTTKRDQVNAIEQDSHKLSNGKKDCVESNTFQHLTENRTGSSFEINTVSKSHSPRPRAGPVGQPGARAHGDTTPSPSKARTSERHNADTSAATPTSKRNNEDHVDWAPAQPDDNDEDNETPLTVSTANKTKGSGRKRKSDQVESTLESTVESTLESTLESKVESTLESTVQSTVESTVESTLESTVESTLESTVESTLESTVQSTVQSTVESTLESTVESMTLRPRIARLCKVPINYRDMDEEESLESVHDASPPDDIDEDDDDDDDDDDIDEDNDDDDDKDNVDEDDVDKDDVDECDVHKEYHDKHQHITNTKRPTKGKNNQGIRPSAYIENYFVIRREQNKNFDGRCVDTATGKDYKECYEFIASYIQHDDFETAVNQLKKGRDELKPYEEEKMKIQEKIGKTKKKLPDDKNNKQTPLTEKQKKLSRELMVLQEKCENLEEKVYKVFTNKCKEPLRKCEDMQANIYLAFEDLPSKQFCLKYCVTILNVLLNYDLRLLAQDVHTTVGRDPTSEGQYQADNQKTKINNFRTLMSHCCDKWLDCNKELDTFNLRKVSKEFEYEFRPQTYYRFYNSMLNTFETGWNEEEAGSLDRLNSAFRHRQNTRRKELQVQMSILEILKIRDLANTKAKRAKAKKRRTS